MSDMVRMVRLVSMFSIRSPETVRARKCHLHCHSVIEVSLTVATRWIGNIPTITTIPTMSGLDEPTLGVSPELLVIHYAARGWGTPVLSEDDSEGCRVGDLAPATRECRKRD